MVLLYLGKLLAPSSQAEVRVGDGSSANGDGVRFGGWNATSIPGGSRGDSSPLARSLRVSCVYGLFSCYVIRAPNFGGRQGGEGRQFCSPRTKLTDLL